MKYNELSIYEQMHIAAVITILENTKINPKEAKALAKKIRDFIRSWYPESDIKNNQSMGSLKKNRKNQSFLFAKLTNIANILVALISKAGNNPDFIGQKDFISEAYNLLHHVQQYAWISLHEIDFRILTTYFESNYRVSEPIPMADYLREEETVNLPALGMKATILDNRVVLTPIFSVKPRFKNDSEYLEDFARTRRFMKPEDLAILPRIIGDLAAADEKGEEVSKKDLEALNLIALNNILDLNSVDPDLKYSFEVLYQLQYKKF